MQTNRFKALLVTAIAFGARDIQATDAERKHKCLPAAVDGVGDPPDEENPYFKFEQPFFAQRLDRYAKKISKPADCFGEDFIIWDQLTSPEWQLCVTEDPDTKEELTYMCTTDCPSSVEMRFDVNNVQEDSFAIEYRRKSKYVPTNAFLSQEDTDKFATVCPIDYNYAMKDSRCTGSYRQGAFQFYPPFVIEACQCKELLDTLEESEDGYSTPLYYVTDEA